MSIEFTQYVLPNGRKRKVWIDRPEEIEDKADQLQSLGIDLDIEILTTGEVSISADDEDGVLSMAVVPNNIEVLAAVDRVIEDAYRLVCDESE